ncbi:unnamed protein product [Sphagnum jensenii]|uniref:Uncharacterized protein n=1 Tax=Sphagnum jensenii TaxID=128206 RepID=A0ABP0VDV1_9BRYO
MAAVAANPPPSSFGHSLATLFGYGGNKKPSGAPNPETNTTVTEVVTYQAPDTSSDTDTKTPSPLSTSTDTPSPPIQSSPSSPPITSDTHMEAPPETQKLMPVPVESTQDIQGIQKGTLQSILSDDTTTTSINALKSMDKQSAASLYRDTPVTYSNALEGMSSESMKSMLSAGGMDMQALQGMGRKLDALKAVKSKRAGKKVSVKVTGTGDDMVVTTTEDAPVEDGGDGGGVEQEDKESEIEQLEERVEEMEQKLDGSVDLLEQAMLPAGTQVVDLPSLTLEENKLYRWILTADGVTPFVSTDRNFMPDNLLMFITQNMSIDRDFILLLVYSGVKSAEWEKTLVRVLTIGMNRGELRKYAKRFTTTVYENKATQFAKLNMALTAYRDTLRELEVDRTTEPMVLRRSREMFNLVVQMSHRLHPADRHIGDITLPQLNIKTFLNANVLSSFTAKSAPLATWCREYRNSVNLFHTNKQTLFAEFPQNGGDLDDGSTDVDATPEQKSASAKREAFAADMYNIEYPLFAAIDTENKAIATNTPVPAGETFEDVVKRMSTDPMILDLKAKNPVLEYVTECMTAYHQWVNNVRVFNAAGPPQLVAETTANDATRQFSATYDNISRMISDYEEEFNAQRYKEISTLLQGWFMTAVKNESRAIRATIQQMVKRVTPYVNIQVRVADVEAEIRADIDKERERIESVSLEVSSEEMREETNLINDTTISVARTQQSFEEMKAHMTKAVSAAKDLVGATFKKEKLDMELRHAQELLCLKSDYEKKLLAVDEQFVESKNNVINKERELLSLSGQLIYMREELPLKHEKRRLEKKNAREKELEELESRYAERVQKARSALIEARNTLRDEFKAESLKIIPEARKLNDHIKSHMKNVAGVYFEDRNNATW